MHAFTSRGSIPYSLAIAISSLSCLCLGASAHAQVCGPAPAWSSRASAPTQIPPRFSTEVSSQTTLNNVLIFGGTAPYPALEQGDTWIYDGSAWSLASTSGPSRRTGHRLAFDAQRNRTVLFGGTGPGIGIASDTWEWDGSSWQQVGAGGPEGRSGFALSYAGNGKVALVGGIAFPPPDFIPTAYNDLWLYDGSTWTETPTINAPPGLEQSSLAFDPIRNRVVLFGGNTLDFEFSGETWELDLTTSSPTWQRQNIPGPSARASANLIFNAASGKLLLAGGINGLGRQTDSWEYDGSQWTLLPASLPTLSGSLGNTALGFFQPSVGQGQPIVLSAAPSATFGYNGSQWTLRQTPLLPALRDYALTYDPAGSRALMFGGANILNNQIAALWSFDGTNWSYLGADGPPAREGASFAAGSSPARALLFGGLSDAGLFGDTWIYQSGTWTQLLSSPLTPSPRYSHSLTYDPSNNRFVLFGGQDDDTGVLGDTWILQGNAWSQITPASSPGPRARASVTWNPQTNRVVLFGGRDENFSSRNDLWAFDGSSWALLSSSGPSPRQSATLAFDASVNRLVLFGGQDEQGLALNDTWTFDGQYWTRLDTPGPAINNPNSFGRSNLASVYFPPLAQTIIFGGFDGETLQSDTVGFSQSQNLPAQITAHPQNQNVFSDQTVHFVSAAVSVFPGLNYQWRRNGETLTNGLTPHGSTVSGATTSSLSIANVRTPDAGQYDLVVSTTCGNVYSGTAQLSVSYCRGDFNQDGVVRVADLLDFFTAWLNQDFTADVNFDSEVSVQDILDFVTLWLAPCF